MEAYPGVVVGTKDSSGDGERIERICREFPDLTVFAGTEKYLLDTLQLGRRRLHLGHGQRHRAPGARGLRPVGRGRGRVRGAGRADRAARVPRRLPDDPGAEGAGRLAEPAPAASAAGRRAGAHDQLVGQRHRLRRSLSRSLAGGGGPSRGGPGGSWSGRRRPPPGCRRSRRRRDRARRRARRARARRWWRGPPWRRAAAAASRPRSPDAARALDHGRRRPVDPGLASARPRSRRAGCARRRSSSRVGARGRRARRGRRPRGRTSRRRSAGGRARSGAARRRTRRRGRRCRRSAGRCRAAGR